MYRILLSVIFSLILIGCGGGSSDSNEDNQEINIIHTNNVQLGPVTGANVTISILILST